VKAFFGETYRQKTILLMLVLIPLIMLVSLQIGYSSMSINNLLEVIGGKGTSQANLIFLQFRLPRMIIAVLVGMGFSVAGCILQGLTGNPLADPGILGINAGAGLVVVIFIVGIGTLSFQSILLMPFFALIGASFTGMIIYKLSEHRYKGLIGTRLILNGIAIQAGVNALMMLVVLRLDRDQHDFLARWQAGSIWNSHWKLVIALLPWIVIGLTVAMYLSRELDILTLGEEAAKGLGLQVKSAKRKQLFIAISMSAAAVAVSGSISFIGLLSPHISRRLVGNKHLYLIPTSALIGAILMLIADIIARKIAEPLELPTGIVVAAIGAPYFMYLLVRGGRKG